MAKVRTLLFAGGTVHDSKGCGDEIEKAIRAAGHFDLTRVDEDLSVFEPPNLDPFELVVFYYTRGQISDAQKNGLLNWLARGGGFVGIHSATISFPDCPEFISMVGGSFLTHPPIRQYQVSVVDPEHPITEGIEQFFVEDEQYIMDYDRRVNILASALWKGDRMPVAWTKPWGNGRVFYLALGHNAEACRDGNFKLLLERGALWAAGRE